MFSFLKSLLYKSSKFDNFRSSPILVSKEVFQRILKERCGSFGLRIISVLFFQNFHSLNSFYSQNSYTKFRGLKNNNLEMYAIYSNEFLSFAHCVCLRNSILVYVTKIFQQRRSYHQYNKICSHIQLK